ncbi:peroxiredoxin, Ohr subfamily/peroxiredoxin, SACOL1771 subfamily [Algoriphagus alkaliphilus]|uniref:Peroxiredoxin, Ohr subfamily/peroxiredoxin, SACOL1771 subfamily n=1 Tax=Algoriphagus alkaliphilus TaxID=279824 RepID=A0A1G5YYD1_9BACT|nr:organic hydroperoxide resistance protein [Algoriphagus alkaliphilus]SDA87551.1 peroxiredoxin, Ohr subfamily/peroxiredoxin, SACOL1771 subfamily [Algoriphagus alkaliphilus]
MEKLIVDYTAIAVNTGGRKGHVRTEDGLLDFDVTMPKEIGGEGGKTNPEQLFAAGYASCFGGTLAATAGKTSLRDSEIKAKVHLGHYGPDSFGLAVDIEVKIPHADSLEHAQKLADLAHEHCVYSKATRGNIEVTVKAVE